MTTGRGGPLVIVGGTGAEGRGLALRFARAGVPIVVGSRDRRRADATAAVIRAAVPGATVGAGRNLEVIERSGRIVLAVPAAGLGELLAATAPALAGKLVIDVVVPLVVRGGFAELVPLSGSNSAAEFIQRCAPGARVVSAFKNVPADWLRDLARPLSGDVVVCGDDPDARAEVVALVGVLDGLRAVDAGRLANARYVEAVAALLVNLNRSYGCRTSIAVLGLPGRR